MALNRHKHKHQYKLDRRHNHPPGYVFRCRLCEQEGMYPLRFIRIDAFWGKTN